MNEIYGTNVADVLSGTAGRDDIAGRAGDDILLGLGGNDDLYGGAGDDRLAGGAGDDELHGGLGSDTFVFDGGRDRIEDLSIGDRVEIHPLLGVQDFAALLARARVAEGGDSTLIVFDAGHTLLLEDVRIGTLRPDQFVFGAGDVVPPVQPPARPTHAADTLTGSDGADVIDALRGNDLVHGAGGNDSIDGGGGADRLFGDAGNDDLDGGRGHDALSGGEGDDDLEGGGGADRLDGGAGNDTLHGGAGADAFHYGSGSDVIEDFRAGDSLRLAASLGVDDLGDVLARARVVDDDVLVDFGGGNTLLLEGVSLASLSTADLLFG